MLSVQLQWGWAVFVAGALSLIASAVVAAQAAPRVSKAAVVIGVLLTALTVAVLSLMAWILLIFELIEREF